MKIKATLTLALAVSAWGMSQASAAPLSAPSAPIPVASQVVTATPAQQAQSAQEAKAAQPGYAECSQKFGGPGQLADYQKCVRAAFLAASPGMAQFMPPLPGAGPTTP